ncbi:MAG: hypothetical protein WAP27_10365, partial [Tepidanaerobacteraceae bacterium]
AYNRAGMLYSRFCIKKMGIPLTLIILQQLDTIDTYLLIDKAAKEFINEVEYDKSYSEVAVDSLLCRNVILLIGSEMSRKNKKTLRQKIKLVYSISV